MLVRETGSGKRFLLEPGDSPLSLGRDSECDLVIRDPRISQLHARLQTEGPFWVWDDLSRHGTEVISVGDEHVRLKNGSRRLHSGDRLYLGATVLRFDQPELQPPGMIPTPPLEPSVYLPRHLIKVHHELARPLVHGTGAAPASNKEICAALFITENTLKGYLSDLYDLFGIDEESGTPLQRRARLAAEWRRARAR